MRRFSERKPIGVARISRQSVAHQDHLARGEKKLTAITSQVTCQTLCYEPDFAWSEVCSWQKMIQLCLPSWIFNENDKANSMLGICNKERREAHMKKVVQVTIAHDF